MPAAFYGMLKERVQNLPLEQAALEVNYWCQENATYQSADDRTSSAMTVYRSGSGRCGEESTFAVTALRSVGIPARQVYAPCGRIATTIMHGLRFISRGHGISWERVNPSQSWIKAGLLMPLPGLC